MPSFATVSRDNPLLDPLLRSHDFTVCSSCDLEGLSDWCSSLARYITLEALIYNICDYKIEYKFAIENSVRTLGCHNTYLYSR